MKNFGVLLFIIICLSFIKQHKNNNLKDKIGQLLVVGFEGTTLDNKTKAELNDNNIGGVILFEKNVHNPSTPRNILNKEQLKSLTSELQSINKTPMFISIDQEGGTVARLNNSKGFFNPPSQQYLGELGIKDSSEYYSHLNAVQLYDLGINMNFTPCVDLIINHENPIIALRERSFSESPEIVAKEAEIVISQHHKKNIITSLKHFPGHGSSKTDSHLGLTDITNTYQQQELEPYRSLICNGYNDIVMVGHLFNSNFDNEYPSSLSFKTINGILRQELGYKGVIATDDMHMNAICNEYSYPHALELALNAGVDMIIIGNNGKVYEANLINETCEIIYELVKSKKVSEDRIDEAYNRIKTLKKKITN